MEQTIKKETQQMLEGLTAEYESNKGKKPEIANELTKDIDAYCKSLHSEIADTKIKKMMAADILSEKEHLERACKNNKFTKAAETLLEGKKSRWEGAAKFFNKLGLTSIANYCTKKHKRINQQAKSQAVKEAFGKELDFVIKKINYHKAKEQPKKKQRMVEKVEQQRARSNSQGKGRGG